MGLRRYKSNNDNVPGDTVEGWQTIYCSLALILVVLFVMLVSYSTADRGKMIELRGNFGEYDISADRDGKKAMPLSLRNSSALVNEAMRSLKRAERASFPEGSVTLERTHRGFKCKLKSDVLFPSGSALINEKAYPYLNEIIRLARENTLFLKVEGHTDAMPIHREEYASNWELSAIRAVNVLRYFLEKGNIPAERLAALGFGQYRQLVANETPEGKAQNRRIEVYLERGRK